MQGRSCSRNRKQEIVRCLCYFFMRTLGVLPSVMNQIAPPSLKLMLNASESDDIPPMPDRTLPYRAVVTARLSATGVPVLGSWGSAWPSHHLNWIRIRYPCVKVLTAPLLDLVVGQRE